MTPYFRIGARGSPLSMTQSRRVQARLAAALGVPEEAREAHFPITPITTTGDKIQDRALLEAGGKGLFTKELDEALLDGRIDMAIHSAKDLPTELAEGTALAATPEREDVRDAWISVKAKTPAELPQGALVGTASLRRQAQLKYNRPDLKIAVLRGNVETRLRKIESGEFDGTFLALAGLKRLGLDHHAASIVDADEMLPAAGQGALAITTRAADSKTMFALTQINDEDVMIALCAERGFLLALDGSCRTAIGAHAHRIEGNKLRLTGEVLAPDGSARFRETGEADLPMTVDAAIIFGISVAHALKVAAGDRLPKMA